MSGEAERWVARAAHLADLDVKASELEDEGERPRRVLPVELVVNHVELGGLDVRLLPPQLHQLVVQNHLADQPENVGSTASENCAQNCAELRRIARRTART